MAVLFRHLDDYGFRDVDPNNHRLTIIGLRYNIVNEDIKCTNIVIPDITDIPEGTLTMVSDPTQEDTSNRSDQDGTSTF